MDGHEPGEVPLPLFTPFHEAIGAAAHQQKKREHAPWGQRWYRMFRFRLVPEGTRDVHAFLQVHDHGIGIGNRGDGLPVRHAYDFNELPTLRCDLGKRVLAGRQFLKTGFIGNTVPKQGKMPLAYALLNIRQKNEYFVGQRRCLLAYGQGAAEGRVIQVFKGARDVLPRVQTDGGGSWSRCPPPNFRWGRDRRCS